MGFANTVSKITEIFLGGGSTEEEDGSQALLGESSGAPKLVSKTIDLPPLRAEDTVESLSAELSLLLEEDQARHDARVNEIKAKIARGDYQPETEDLAKAILAYPDED